MEKKATNEMEMAAQENEKREKTEKTAQGWVKINSCFWNLILIIRRKLLLFLFQLFQAGLILGNKSNVHSSM